MLIAPLALLACFPRLTPDAVKDDTTDLTPDTANTGELGDTAEPVDTADSGDTDTGGDTSLDTGEPPACEAELDAARREGDAIATGTPSVDDVDGSCGTQGASDSVVRWTAPRAGAWVLDTVGSTAEDTVLFALGDDCSGEIACDDDWLDGWSSLDLTMAAGQSVLLGVEGGAWTLNAWQGSCVDTNIGSLDGVTGDNAGLTTELSASCGRGYASDYVLRWVAPSAGVWQFTTERSTFDTILVVLDGEGSGAADCSGAELACGDDTGEGSASQTWSTVSLSLRAGDVIFLGIGGYEGDTGTWELTATRL